MKKKQFEITAIDSEVTTLSKGVKFTLSTGTATIIDSKPVGVITKASGASGSEELFGGFCFPDTEYIFTISGTEKIAINGTDYLATEASGAAVAMVDIFGAMGGVHGPAADGGLI
jgi:hypothetical protein